MQMAASLGMAHRTRWIPGRVDIEMVYPALDLFILTSIFEGFPNVLGEAAQNNCRLSITPKPR